MLTDTGVGAESARILHQLERDGVVVLPGFVSGARLAGMQRAFAHALQRLKVNTTAGFEKSELLRDMVEDVLTLDQGFVDVALDPRVQQTLGAYIGPEFQLVEAKGWLSRPSRRDFHGWHGDEWYDKSQVTDRIPREVKLALYLTDVESGHFEYIRGSHQQEAPRIYGNAEIGTAVSGEIVRVLGQAGTACLFDTSGVHRQSTPILQPRHAIFLNYHESRVPLQPADVKGNRYHPLILNAAFLGELTPEECRILGFGDQSKLRLGHSRPPQFPRLERVYHRSLLAALQVSDFSARVRERLKRTLGVRG
jgi:hypothetical protein